MGPNLMGPSAPRIGVTGPDEGGGAMWLFTWLGVWLAGGQAVRITPRTFDPQVAIHGLILGGGADVGPQHYGQERRPPRPIRRSHIHYLLDLIVYPLTWLLRKLAGRNASAGTDAARDELEFALLREAVSRRLPVLGICRGEQLINVYFGGSLHQELTGFYTEDAEIRTILPRKRVTILAETHLASLIGTKKKARVNALHRQGVDKLGTGIRIAAQDRNGIIQAIEHCDFTFLVGVQWHPEFLPQVPQQRGLFRALVQQAREVVGDVVLRNAASGSTASTALLSLVAGP